MQEKFGNKLNGTDLDKLHGQLKNWGGGRKIKKFQKTDWLMTAWNWLKKDEDKYIHPVVMEEEENKQVLPFSDESFKELWNNWLKVRKYKDKLSPEKELEDLSHFDVEFAKMLVIKGIKGGYRALVYEDTAQRYQKWLQDKNGNNYASAEQWAKNIASEMMEEEENEKRKRLNT